MKPLPFTLGLELEVGGHSNDDRSHVRRLFHAWSVPDSWSVHLDWTWMIETHLMKGPEIKSPILRHYEDLDVLGLITSALKEGQFRVNPRCGLHVHIGMANDSFKTVKKFVIFLLANEDAFFSMADETRQNNKFCSRVPQAMFDEVKKANSPSELIMAWRDSYHPNGNGRYFWVNARSMLSFGTIEIRLMQMVLDDVFIKGWVHTLLLSATHAKLARRISSKRRAVSPARLIAGVRYHEPPTPEFDLESNLAVAS